MQQSPAPGHRYHAGGCVAGSGKVVLAEIVWHENFSGWPKKRCFAEFDGLVYLIPVGPNTQPPGLYQRRFCPSAAPNPLAGEGARPWVPEARLHLPSHQTCFARASRTDACSILHLCATASRAAPGIQREGAIYFIHRRFT
jgi:hypothetical protein